MTSVALAARVSLTPAASSNSSQLSQDLISACYQNEDLFLDVVDATLNYSAGSNHATLRRLLETGGSIWTVSTDGKSLVERVDATSTAAMTAATTPADAASAEIAEAWSKIYGRQPDPSDAWDHAIKAVETLLAPIVIPSNPTATLGTILSALEAKPEKWTFVLQPSGTSGGVETLAKLARTIWPNPDRHGGNASRKPSLAEATAAVQTALLIVQWCRDGALTKAP
jgi:hypothetical protein